MLGPDRLALMRERLRLGDGAQLTLVQPADVDAVMDMYIRRGGAGRLVSRRGAAGPVHVRATAVVSALRGCRMQPVVSLWQLSHDPAGGPGYESMKCSIPLG